MPDSMEQHYSPGSNLFKGIPNALSMRGNDGTCSSFKLTKKLADMHPIEELPNRIREIA